MTNFCFIDTYCRSNGDKRPENEHLNNFWILGLQYLPRRSSKHGWIWYVSATVRCDLSRQISTWSVYTVAAEKPQTWQNFELLGYVPTPAFDDLSGMWQISAWSSFSSRKVNL